ncbi:MAG TPA: ATP synthase F0 subunit B [Acidobacteriota bacterium]|jgi:F-type H+-transporting ATPase subunit b|nr:ATP synthase F0 subunit B [Acidobacteriota bacterium]HQO20501.1 ATP synthase F0 subunit B [Acidobacteriota bacterium]HQQ46726.1 ATP synthase F0 subunit B [Acidobacteriota bacterium]
MDLVGDIARHYLHIPIVMGAVLVYGILLHFAFFRPVRKVLDERKNRIDESSALSLKAREESLEKLELYEAKLSEARKEAARLREKARAEVSEFHASLIREVRKEIEDKSAARNAEFERSLGEAEKQMRRLAPGLAAKMAEKILDGGAPS